jgi:hypothetical protein
MSEGLRFFAFYPGNSLMTRFARLTEETRAHYPPLTFLPADKNHFLSSAMPEATTRSARIGARTNALITRVTRRGITTMYKQGFCNILLQVRGCASLARVSDNDNR